MMKRKPPWQKPGGGWVIMGEGNKENGNDGGGLQDLWTRRRFIGFTCYRGMWWGWKALSIDLHCWVYTSGRLSIGLPLPKVKYYCVLTIRMGWFTHLVFRIFTECICYKANRQVMSIKPAQSLCSVFVSRVSGFMCMLYAQGGWSPPSSLTCKPFMRFQPFSRSNLTFQN